MNTTKAVAARAASSKTAARKAAPKAAAPARLAAVPKPAAPDLFHEALARVLLHEGGQVNNRHDPGGRTNKGITQRVYAAWRASHSLPVRDVFQIDDMEVEAIYRFQYWQPIHGDALPRGVGYVVLDGAVNSGPKQSVKWLQRALGEDYTSTIDGQIGSVTLQAVAAFGDDDKLIANICARRMVFLQALKTWQYFRKGWTQRVQDVLAAGQAWASGSVPAPAEYRANGEAKAVIEDAKDAPVRAPGDLATGGGGSVVLGSGVLEKVKEQLEPYAGAFHWVSTIVVWLVILGIIVGGAGFAWRWWAAREKAKLNDALDIQS